MDSLTQIVLGAAMGELVAGRKIGYKAALWGAFAGTIPDLDVLFGLFVDPIDYLHIHRGFTHSIFFSVIAAPVLAWIAARFHKRESATYRDWFWLFYLALLTHPLLDWFTGYGTQLLFPFTDYAFELNTIFIIDPLYTLPFLGCLIAALRLPKEHPRRKKWAWAGVGISSSYLLLTVLLKLTAIPQFEAELERQNISYERMMTIPGPFNSFLWRALVETEDGFYQGNYSLFDDRSKKIEFQYLPRNTYLIEPVKDTRALDRLLWFSKGYYHANIVDGNLYMNDLRFGSYNSWAGDMYSFIFAFRIFEDDNGEVLFEQEQMPVDFRWSDFGVLLSRTLGQTAEEGDSDRLSSVEDMGFPETFRVVSSPQ